MFKEMSRILSKQQNREIRLLLLLYTISSLLDLIGISVIYPFIMMVLDKDAVINNILFRKINCLCALSIDDFLLLCAFMMILFYIVKNIFQYWVFKSLNKFLVNFNQRVCEDLLEGYLYREYEFHLNTNSANLINKINIDVTNVMGMLRNLIMVFSDMILFAMLVIVIFVLYPIITLLLVIGLGIFSILFYLIYGKKTKRIGDKILGESEKRTKWLMQAFDGVKEIKMKRKESYFAENVNNYTKNYFRLFLQNANIGLLPTYLLEVICVSIILLLVIWGMRISNNSASFIATMGVFALAAFRLFPKIGALNTEISNIAYGKASLIEIINDKEKFIIDIDEGKKAEKYTYDKNLTLKNISFSYFDANKEILKDVSLKIKKGDYIGIIGESGTGKSTLVDLLLGLLRPTQGNVLLDGKEVNVTDENWKRLIGYVPQSVFIFDDTIINNIILGDKITADVIDKVEEILKVVQLGDFIKELPNGIFTEVGERGARISGGQRQRLGLARALYSNPEILVLDEATSALDNKTEAAIMKTINDIKGKRTIIAVAHRLSTVEKCDYIYEVNGGKVFLRDKSQIGM